MLTGLRMNQTIEFFKQMKIATSSRTTFYEIQKDYVLPVIWQEWIEMRTDLYNEFRGKELTVSGDGQFDSPGYTADNCFYTVVESETDKVNDLDFDSGIGSNLRESTVWTYWVYSFTKKI
jgi:hypothetical protein